MSFDRYTQVEHLTSTEAGELYRAVDPVLGRTVLLRALPAGPYEPPAVAHSCLVEVLGSFEEDGRRVLVEEWVDGSALDDGSMDWIGTVPAEQRIAWLRCLAEALVEAHQSGVVHGSLSAAWVVVPEGGPPRLAGLGTGALLGRPDADEAADALAFGELAQFLVFLPRCPPDVARAIQGCLAPDEDRRLAALAVLAVLPWGEAPATMGEGALRAVPERSPEPSLAHENVQFTVYRPRAVSSETWSRLLFFAHLDTLPGDADPDEQDPLEQVEETARRVLGDEVRSFRETVQDSLAALPEEGEVTVVPEMDGVRFNPPSVTFLWLESVHWHEFRMKAERRLSRTTARGRIVVRHGAILLAEIPVSFAVDRPGAVEGPDSAPSERETARAYRSIFPSYSHRDTGVVEQAERYAHAVGDRYLRDVLALRSGEVWNDRLLELIERADVFQLFWSTNAVASPYVEQEWRHALALKKPHFVRPTYWERPLPEDPDRGLPTDELRRLHFHFLGEEEAPREPSMPASSPVGEVFQPAPDETLARIDPSKLPQRSAGRSTSRRLWASAAALIVMAGLGWLVVPQLLETPVPEEGTIELASTSPDGVGGEVQVEAQRTDDGEERLAVSIPVRTEGTVQSLRWTREEIEAIAQQIQNAPPGSVVEIRATAATIDIGDEQASLRATRVRDQLEAMGVSPDRLRVVDCAREESAACAADLGAGTSDDRVLIFTRTVAPAQDAEQLEIDLEAMERVRADSRLRVQPRRRPPG